MKRILTKALQYMYNIFHPSISIFARCEDSNVSKKAKIHRFVKLDHAQIGDYTYVCPKAQIVYASIGRFCSIAGNSKVGMPMHPICFLSTSPIFYSPQNAIGQKWVKKNTYFEEFEKCKVGNDVWIGANAIVMGGINIGNGAVIAAGAVVTKDVPPYAIVGGIPAKIIRFRFEEPVRNALEQSKWWEKEDLYLKGKIELFHTNKIDINNLP